MNEPGIRPGDLLTVPQGLALLPVGRATLYALVASGEIASIRVSTVGSRRGRVLIFRASLEQYVRRLREGAPRRAPARFDPDSIREQVLARTGAA